MNRMKRIFLFCVFLSLVILINIVSFTAYADTSEGIGPTSGTCGTKLTWSLSTDGTLTISGTGAMTNYTSSSGTPWEAKKSSIKAVVVNNGVTTIGDYAFAGCSNLTNVTMPTSLRKLGNSSFQNCDSLKQITIPNGVTSIGDNVFYNCDVLTTITLPDSVENIGYEAFSHCDLLASITLPANLITLGRDAFYWSRNLSSVSLPGSLSIIPSYAFYYCNIKELEIPEGVTTISDDAFISNSALTSIHLPSSIERIESNAFGGCVNITDVYYPGTLADAENILFGTGNTYLTGATWHCGETPTIKTPTPMSTSTLIPTSTPIATATPAPEGTLTISGPDEVVMKQSITLTAEIGGSLQINNSGVIWSTSNKKIATVDGIGTVTGKKAGEVTIRACASANPAICGSKTITVIPLGKSVIITDNDNGTKIIDLGTKGTGSQKITYQLSASVSPADAEQGITWSSANPAIATVDQNGLVTATGTGKVNITATAADGSHKSKSVKINVISSIQPGSISLSGAPSVIQKQKVTLNVSYTQAAQPLKPKLIWSSSDPSVAKVSNKGIVTGASEGDAVISACSAANSSACGSFPIHSIGIASSVVINDNDNGSKLIDIGTAGTAGEKLTYSLSANVLPANVKQEVIWSSSNPAVASVDENGLVTGHSAGSAAITATSNDDAHKKTKVNLKVTSNVQPGSLTLSGPDTLGIKESKSLTAAFSQLNQPVKNKVKWSSSDAKIAKVSNGTVTGVSDGTAVITACSAVDASVCAAQTVYVGESAASINLNVPVSLFMAAVPESEPETAMLSMTIAEPENETLPATLSLSGSGNEEPELPQDAAAPEEPTPTAAPQLQFANEEMSLHVGELASLEIENPQNESFMVMIKGDENALSYDESANTVTALSEGSLTAYLADVNTVDIVDSLSIQVLPATSVPEKAKAETTALPTAQPTAVPETAVVQPTIVPTEQPTVISETGLAESTAVPTAAAGEDPETESEAPVKMMMKSVRSFAPVVTISEPTFEEKEFTLSTGESLILPVQNPNDLPILVGMNGDTDSVLWDESEYLLTGISEGEITAFLSTIDPLEVKDICTIHVVEKSAAEPTEETYVEPSEEPASETSDEYTIEPTEEQTPISTVEPTPTPTEESAAEPSDESTADLTEEPTPTPTEEASAEPTEEPTPTPTEEPTPIPLIDPYFESEEYELRVGETMQVWYHNPDNQTVYLVLSEGSELVEWDETSFSIKALEPGDLTILLTTTEPYAVKDSCVVHILEAEKEPVKVFRDEEVKMVTNELIRLDDLLIEGTAEDYEIDIREYEEYLYWDAENGTLTAYKDGDAELILRHPDSEEEIDSLLIHIWPAPLPEKEPEPTEGTTNGPQDESGLEPSEESTNSIPEQPVSEPEGSNPEEAGENPSDAIQPADGNPENTDEGTDPEGTDPA